MTCAECGAKVGRDECGLTRKLFNRGCSYCLCYACLATRFRTDTESLRQMAEAFRESGCMLFQ